MRGAPSTESRGRLAGAIAFVVYDIGFGLTHQIVRDALGWVCGSDGWCISSSAPWKFWFGAPLLPAFFAWMVARRLLDGPPVVRDDLVMFFSAPDGDGRGSGPRVADLLASLATRGYSPRGFLVSDQLRPRSPATGLEPLLGSKFLVLETRSRARRAFVRMMLSTRDAKGTGIIEVSDSEQGLYAELATYLVRGLEPVLPNLCYRRLNSALSPEAARDLALPASPVHLG